MQCRPSSVAGINKTHKSLYFSSLQFTFLIRRGALKGFVHSLIFILVIYHLYCSVIYFPFCKMRFRPIQWVLSKSGFEISISPGQYLNFFGAASRVGCVNHHVQIQRTALNFISFCFSEIIECGIINLDLDFWVYRRSRNYVSSPFTIGDVQCGSVIWLVLLTMPLQWRLKIQG